MTPDRVLAWMDRRNFVSVRTAVLGVTVWMTWKVTVWAIAFSNLWLLSGKDGVETGLVIAAVTAPFTALQVFAFRHYIESRK